MFSQAVEDALEDLLALPRRAEDSAACESGDGSLTSRLFRSAAAFVRALDDAGQGRAVRDRAGLLERETAVGTTYDKIRRDFVALFRTGEELDLPPLEEDFGVWLNGFDWLLSFPSSLRILSDRTAEYARIVPTLRSAREYRAEPVDWPLQPMRQDQEQAKKPPLSRCTAASRD